jgi:hypothetical protein
MAALIEIYANNAATTLAAGISSTATSLTVLSGSGTPFPNPGANQFFRFTLNDALTGLEYEIIYCTARSGDTFSGLLRGQEGTTALAWLSADKVFEGVTAGAMANLTQVEEVQQNLFNYATDTGAANAYNIAFSPSLQTPVPGAVLYWIAANPNTTASTVIVNGSSAYPLLGQGRAAMQGGEIKSFCAMTYDAALSSYVLLSSTGGAVQGVPTVTKSAQHLTLGQAQAQFAALNGNAGQAFAAASLASSVLSTGSGTTLLLESNTAIAAVNVGNTAYVPMYVGAPTTGNSAVNLTYAGATYAAINGSTSQAFSASNLTLSAGLLTSTAGALQLRNNTLVGCYNVAGSAFVPLACAPAQNGNEVVTLGQLQNPLVAASNAYGVNTYVGCSVAFTAPGPGLLIAWGSRNDSAQDASSYPGYLYINGSAYASDDTLMTMTHMEGIYTAGGYSSAEYYAGGQSFTVWVCLIFIPYV